MSEAANRNPAPRVRFDYIKSNLFRTAHADGVWAGTNGFSDVILSFFSERTPIPKRTVHIVENNVLGEELPEERVVRPAIVREVEISISMSIEVARSMRDLLSRHIAAV